MGTASAKPAKLQAFVDAAAEIRGELEGRIRELRASYDSFQQSGSAGVANPDLMDVELPGFIARYVDDETFVATVRQAFLDADSSLGPGGLASVDVGVFDAAFRDAAQRAGIDPDALVALRLPVTVDDPIAAGIPRTSGFVADPVCTATGHLVEAEDDFTWPDRLAVLRWRRTYSSRFVAGGPFGRGWASWATVMCLPQDDGSVGYHGPDGQMAVFAPTTEPGGDGGAARDYLRVPGVAATLARVEGGTGWELRWDWHSDHPGEVWTFEGGAGRLRTVAGPAVGTTRFTYEGGALVAVEHDSGRRLDVEWADGRIVAVRSSCGRSARYHYDEAGDLVRSERVLGDRSYEVDEQGRIVEVWDADGVRLCRNTYDDQGRVLMQVSPFGRETVFRYESGNRTVVSDTEDGPVTVYLHDHRGRLTGLIDHQGHRLERSFDAEGRCVAATGFDGASTSQTFAPDGRAATRVGADGVSERWEYDEQDRVVRHEVEGGRGLSFDYDGDGAFPARLSGPDGWEMRVEVVDGLLRSLTDADGVSVRFDHDPDGNVVATTNGVGAVTRTVPHVSGEAARVTMPDGASFDCDRDDAGRLLALRTPVGDEVRVEWSPAGRLTALVEPGGARTTFEHGSHGTVERVVDALGAAIELRYDHLERLVGLSAPGGAKWGFSYSSLGLLSLVHDPAGASWSYEYDAEGRMVAATDPLGHDMRQRYDDAGRLAALVDRSGNATRYSRDVLGRVTAEETADGAVTAYEWDTWGRPTAVRSPDGEVLSYAYTPAGRVREVRTAGGRATTADYDAAGRLVAVTDATGATTRFEWDACDRVTTVVAPSGRRTVYGYDAAGRLTDTEQGGRRWRTTYDHAGRPTSVTDPAGATVRYAYDLRGKLAAATDALGATVRFRYDERGNPVAALDAAGGLSTTRYDAMRRPVAVTDRLGRTTQLGLDATGRMVRRELPTGDVVEWRRDRRGLATGVRVNGVDVATFDRDAAGRPVLVHEPARGRTFRLRWSRGGRLVSFDADGRAMRWEHDDDGLVTARHDPLGRTTRYAYDAAGRLASVSLDGWGPIDLERDADGRLVALRGIGVERRWDHDAGGLVVGHRESRDGTDRETALARDAAGRVVEARSGGTVARYRYDAAGQLVAASGPDGAWVWRYDPGGRLVREEGPAGVRTFHYDEADQLLRVDGPDGPTTFTYDAAGRRTGEDGPSGVRRYSWDALGRLSGLSSGGRIRSIDVDAFGQLAAFDGTPLTWDPAAAVPELLAIGDRGVVGLPGLPLGLAGPGPDDPDPTDRSAGPGPDDLASVGPLPADWRGPGRDGLDPWGAPLPGQATGTEAEVPALGFLGELDLGELTWLHNRVYDPATRQFLSPDPLPGIPGLPVATNPYHYANNDPVGFVDPLGLQPLSIDAYNEIREQETSVQWANVAMVGLTAASFFVPGGPLVAVAIGAAIGMAPGVVQGVTTGDWDIGGIVKGGLVGGIAGRVGFAFGGTSATLVGAMGRGAAGGAATGMVGEGYDMLPLPGSDGQFDLETVAVSSALGAGTGGMAHRLAGGTTAPAAGEPAALPAAPVRPGIEAPPTRLAIEPPRRPDFVAGPPGSEPPVPVSQSRMRAGLDSAGFPRTDLPGGKGTQHTLPDGSSVRLMEPTNYAPRRASFENANGGDINPFTGKPVQPPQGLTKAERLQFVRSRTHVEQTP